MPTRLRARTPSPVRDPGSKVVGGRLRRFAHRWRQLQPSNRLLSIIQDGLWWPMMDESLLCRRPPMDSYQVLCRRGQRHLLKAMQDTIDEYILKGMLQICQNSHSTGLVSLFFPVQKKNGKWRGCLDLRPLNSHIPCPHFKMEGLQDVRHLVMQNDWLTKVDISDAYPHVPIHPSRQKFLRFLWKGVLYQFVSMPFGLNVAPREFTKLLRPVVGHLRSLGVRCLIYLDDILIVASSERQSRRHTELVVHWLRQLGFLVNREKCELDPSRRREFLGLLIDTHQMTFEVPRDKIRGIRRQVGITRRLAFQGRLTARALASLIGKTVAVSPAVQPARLFSRFLNADLNRTLRTGPLAWESTVFLSKHSLRELDWWRDQFQGFNGHRFDRPPETCQLFTDASNSGWGASLLFPTRTSWNTFGAWDPLLLSFSINFREMFAVLLAIRNLRRHLRGQQVLVYTDNATTLAYLNNHGGRLQHLNFVRKAIHKEMVDSGCFLRAKFIPGVENVTADRLSRLPRGIQFPTSWILSVFHKAEATWGPHTVDAFATASTALLPRFFSSKPEPLSSGVNALFRDWNHEALWLFPPRNLIRRVVEKLLREKGAAATMIVPPWTAQSWMPTLQLIAESGPFRIFNPWSQETLLVFRISARSRTI
eukprot:Rmarinus@m.22682